MTKLHELLAVETDLDKTAHKIIDETQNDFSKKEHLFVGSSRVYHSKEDGYGDVPPVNQKMETTVHERLEYTFKHLNKLLDVTYQKEVANSEAKADIKIGETIIAKDVPATFLLNLEKRLNKLRPVLAAMPTLPAGIEFIKAPDIGKHVHKMKNPEVKMRTAKTYKSKVVYEATEHHPAQVERWTEDIDIGNFEKNVWTGCLTSYDKSQILERADDLIRAVKKARQRANQVEVKKNKVGQSITNYLLG